MMERRLWAFLFSAVPNETGPVPDGVVASCRIPPVAAKLSECDADRERGDGKERRVLSVDGRVVVQEETLRRRPRPIRALRQLEADMNADDVYYPPHFLARVEISDQ